MSDYYFCNGELYHYGVKGMKWGHRKAVYDQGYTSMRQTRRDARAQYRNQVRSVKNQNKQITDRIKAENALTPEQKAARRKKAIIAGAAVTATALAVIGGYKLNKYIKTTNCQIAAKKGHEFAEKMFAMNDKSMAERLMNNPNNATYRKVTLNSGSGAAAREAANRAYKDSFRTAAKNVYNYRKSNDKHALKNLGSVDWYSNLPGSSAVYEIGKKRKR